MLNPSIGKLIENYENRYRLVMDIAKTARTISKKAESEETILTEKPVSIAIDKMANDLNL